MDRVGLRELADSPEDIRHEKKVWRSALHTYERPDVQLMQGAIINVRRHRIDDGSVSDREPAAERSRTALRLLLICNVVLAGRLDAGRLDATDGGVHRNASQVWVRTKTLPIPTSTSIAAHWTCRRAAKWSARFQNVDRATIDRTRDVHVHLCA